MFALRLRIEAVPPDRGFPNTILLTRWGNTMLPNSLLCSQTYLQINASTCYLSTGVLHKGGLAATRPS